MLKILSLVAAKMKTRAETVMKMNLARHRKNQMESEFLMQVSKSRPQEQLCPPSMTPLVHRADQAFFHLFLSINLYFYIFISIFSFATIGRVCGQKWTHRACA